MKKGDITPELVSRLVASQFPDWADLPVTRVELDGWDNTTFRLGSSMSVRLPSHEIEALRGTIDVASAVAVWEAALGADRPAPPVWVHGDVTGSNLLVVGGRLSAVIDFGCSAVGDPACDTTIAWTFLSGESRATFTALLAVDEATWAGGRGWALWKALVTLAGDLERPGHAARAAKRVGWASSATEIISDLIDDHRHAR